MGQWGLLLLLQVQLSRWDGYIPELPPYSIEVLSGHYTLSVQGQGTWQDSTGDFTAFAERVPWQEGQEWYPQSCIFLSDPLYQQQLPLQYLYRYSWQLHRSGRRLRLWKGFPAYQLNPLPPMRQTSLQTFSTQSVLASGRWYKVATAQAGIYKITAQTLRALGLDPATIDPRNLRVYGQVGGLLPQSNQLPAPDDLVELPIYFPGESDGRWDPADAAYFWAESPDSWYEQPSSTSRPFFHLKNPYTDSCYYFITVELGPGRRIQNAPPVSGSLSPQTRGLFLFFHEKESYNILKSGRVWLGEDMTSRNPTLQLTLPIPALENVSLRIQLAASSPRSSQIKVAWNGVSLPSVNIPPIPGPADNRHAQWGELHHTFSNTPSNPTLTLTYEGTGTGWLDYVEIIGWMNLSFQGSPFLFRLPSSSPMEVRLTAAQEFWIWDVTEGISPQNIPLSIAGGIASFAAPGDKLRSYYAFRLEHAIEVRPLGAVRNQNLHSLQDIRFVIATTEALRSLAQRFCELHPEAGPCVVVTDEELYHEFSGGRPDICALRNFLRMLYRRASRAELRPQFLLIVGAASYNFKQKAPYLFPTYQSRESFYPPGTYGSDDFFGFLDDSEGFWPEGYQANWYDPRESVLPQPHLLDLAISRLPVYSVQDLENYLHNLSIYLQNPAARGSWQQKFIFFSDYKDNGLHTTQAEELAQQVRSSMPYVEVSKIYVDRYPAQPRASGLVFPQAQEALLAQLNQGALIAHYVGHGNEYSLQGFEFFSIPLLRQLQNRHRFIFFVTATCEWGKWDDPRIRSGGVESLFMRDRGAIALFTSTRKVFASLNFALSRNFYTEFSTLFRDKRSVRLGELMLRTKNSSWGGGMDINTRSFSFLGDPLLPLGLPMYEALITHIGQGPPSSSLPDTLRPLRPIRIEGEIRTPSGELVQDFHGEAILHIWDKAVTRRTLISQTSYSSQEILLFSGTASVRSGKFSIIAYLPIDILPDPGFGRLSVWAQSADGRSAAGAETRFIVCCPDSLPSLVSPPSIRLYINDTTWIPGSVVPSDPLLIAYIYDSLGINLSNLGVGRELKAALNNKEYFLSSYYRSKRDQPNQGTLEYRFSNLAPGEYKLTLRAYNLAGQEGKAETYFIVAEQGKLQLRRIFNFPNPFTTSTTFCFEHTQPGQLLEARVLIYTLTGRLVQTLSTTVQSTNGFVQAINWDGLDSAGERLGRGVYVYRLEVRNPLTGETAHAQEKLVILR